MLRPRRFRRQVRERLERHAEVTGRLVGRVTRQGRRAGELVVDERALVIVATLEVHRKLGRTVLGRIARRLLLVHADHPVQTGSSRHADPFVKHVPVERVQEAIAPGERPVERFGDAGIVDQHALRSELLEQLLDGLRALAERGGDGGDGELVPDDARHLDGGTHGRGEGQKAPLDQLAQTDRRATRRLGQRSRDAPAALAPDERPARDQIVHGIDHEQGMPVRAIVEMGREPPHLVARCDAEAGIDVGLGVSRGQRCEGDLLALPASLEVLLHAAERVIVDDQVGRPEGPDDQQPGGFTLARDVRDQVDGRGIAPVEILEHEHQRPRTREDLERFGHLPEHPSRPRDHRLAGDLPGGPLRLERRELRDPGGRMPPQDATDLAGPVVPSHLPDRIEERQIGLAPAVLLETLSPCDPRVRVVFDVGEEALDERRLSDSALARHEDDAADATGGLPECGTQQRQLVRPADHRARRARRLLEGVVARHEAIALASDCFDVARRVRVVAEGLAQCPHGDLEHASRDVGPGPQRPDELVPADDLAWAYRQIAEHGERTRLQGDGLVALPELGAVRVQAERSKGHHARGHGKRRPGRCEHARTPSRSQPRRRGSRKCSP
jgi:hypothetical protein